VSLTQYTRFLNAVAATDTYGLYNPSMATDLNIAGIERSGDDGNYTYAVIGSGDRPVTYVSWFDAARFCNWLHNDCATGAQDASTTERGAYTLDGATSGGLDITVNRGAKYWIPSEDEWYKAAYYQPQSEGGPVDGYWDYPTKRDIPNAPGNTIGSAENQANIYTTVYSVTQSGSYDSNQNYLTEGGAYEGSGSFYGTFDQGGNVWEWSDAVISSSFRGLRGGSWFNFEILLRSSNRDDNIPDNELNNIGFRVASP
jgi:formylglycine-generating enzyme required for sulfatase activity